jgi:inosine-uridine nucleoside N-ribohydrolase
MLPVILLSTLLALTTPQRIIIDTDPGEFSDDNVAIAMCLRSPRQLQVEGLTIVSGNAWAAEGFESAGSTLRLLGRRTPVYLGAQQPLSHTAEESLGEKPLEFAGAFARPRPPARTEDAVEFLIQSLQREPLTILALGPLTNIARLLERRPDLAPRIQRLVIMGGNVRVPGNSTQAAEFNFWFDPEAARIVLRSAVREKLLFALDICNQAVIRKGHFDRLTAARTPLTVKYAEAAGQGYPGFLKDPSATGYFWDELAAGYLIDPGIVRREETLYLDVVTARGPRYGAVVPLDRKDAPAATPVRVMLDLDFERAFELVRQLLSQ